MNHWWLWTQSEPEGGKGYDPHLCHGHSSVIVCHHGPGHHLQQVHTPKQPPQACKQVELVMGVDDATITC
jgi:hypothetical protein